MEDIANAIGLKQSTASRNTKKLAVGPRAQKGYGLVTVELDPYDGRSIILWLSKRGHELINLITDSALPKLKYQFSKDK